MRRPLSSGVQMRPPLSVDAQLRQPAAVDAVMQPPPTGDVQMRPPLSVDTHLRQPTAVDALMRPPANGDVQMRPPRSVATFMRPPSTTAQTRLAQSAGGHILQAIRFGDTVDSQQMGVYENSFPAASFEDMANNDMFVNELPSQHLTALKRIDGKNQDKDMFSVPSIRDVIE
ncbi:unnamed protein product [Miscanthus lutarioriparius]|uniref:Uncharacterized protein n=1 Tax=Miscanthus lutarioriparius TaxID=422564 RepID=A0A811P5U8_9POAL|nr:unnamed protein product [Miscanthus lutarioriparius]